MVIRPSSSVNSSHVHSKPGVRSLQVALSPEGAIVVQDDLNNSYQRNG